MGKRGKKFSNVDFLGALAELRKAAISFIMSACLTAGKNSVSHWMDFGKICYLFTLRISINKIHISLKSEKNSGYFT